jgi:signal transduction protein with GAF and PtsI domain
MSVAIAAVVMGSMVAIITPFAKVWMRKIELRSVPSSSPDIEARLARIEQAIEAVAVEIERISEGQRFTTKLLSEARPEREGGAR